MLYGGMPNAEIFDFADRLAAEAKRLEPLVASRSRSRRAARRGARGAPGRRFRQAGWTSTAEDASTDSPSSDDRLEPAQRDGDLVAGERSPEPDERVDERHPEQALVASVGAPRALPQRASADFAAGRTGRRARSRRSAAHRRQAA